jgi:hypothetical protein
MLDALPRWAELQPEEQVKLDFDAAAHSGDIVHQHALVPYLKPA